MKFRCPECGNEDFWAFYRETTRQDVELIASETGVIDPSLTEYLGCTETVGDPGEDDQYECASCGWVYDVPDHASNPTAGSSADTESRK